jgi:hypothetical protein
LAAVRARWTGSVSRRASRRTGIKRHAGHPDDARNATSEAGTSWCVLAKLDQCTALSIFTVTRPSAARAYTAVGRDSATSVAPAIDEPLHRAILEPTDHPWVYEIDPRAVDCWRRRIQRCWSCGLTSEHERPPSSREATQAPSLGFVRVFFAKCSSG